MYRKDDLKCSIMHNYLQSQHSVVKKPTKNCGLVAIKLVPYAPNQLTQNHAKKWAQAAENDAMPLQFDFHPHYGEGGRGHTLKKSQKS